MHLYICGEDIGYRWGMPRRWGCWRVIGAWQNNHIARFIFVRANPRDGILNSVEQATTGNGRGRQMERFKTLLTASELATLQDLADDGTFQMTAQGAHRFLCTMRDSLFEDGEITEAQQWAARVIDFNLAMYGRI